MRIALLYPPPWAIAAPGTAGLPEGAEPPRGVAPGAVPDGDETTLPCGLMSLAAQARRAGHRVTLFNLYTFAWSSIEKIIGRLPADIYGLSCLTVNRRGTAALARLIRRVHPSAHIVVGGPHAGALPLEILRHWPAVDSIVIGEGEQTFTELVSALAAHRPLTGIAGLAWRCNGQVHLEKTRARINDLDGLACPYDHYRGNVVLTSRGCPHACTFCASPALWSRRVVHHSPDYIMGVLQRIVGDHGCKQVAFKDDTFTANRRLALELCQRIRASGLRFCWSCDSRADTLDDRLLLAMRLAGCERLSIGVESAAPAILAAINKNLSPAQVLRATAIAKRFGFQVRYYMMAGNRGEDATTLRASLDFLNNAQPNQYVFSILSLYPGTREFNLAETQGLVSRAMFFQSDRPVFKWFHKNRGGPELLSLVEWVLSHLRVTDHWHYSIAQRRRIVQRLPGLPAAHLDLGNAYARNGRWDEARTCYRQSLSLGHGLPGLVFNNLACAAAADGKLAKAAGLLDKARTVGAHWVVEHNWQRLEKGIGLKCNQPIELQLHEGFDGSTAMVQPAEPGPIRADSLEAGQQLAGEIFEPQRAV